MVSSCTVSNDSKKSFGGLFTNFQLPASVMETHGNSIQNTDKPLSSSFTSFFFFRN